MSYFFDVGGVFNYLSPKLTERLISALMPTNGRTLMSFNSKPLEALILSVKVAPAFKRINLNILKKNDTEKKISSPKRKRSRF